MNYHVMQRAHNGADLQLGRGQFGEEQSRGAEQPGETSCDVHGLQGGRPSQLSIWIPTFNTQVLWEVNSPRSILLMRTLKQCALRSQSWSAVF